MLMDVQIGRALWEPCSWNGNHLSTCSKREENEENSARFGRSQDLPVARWMASSQARWAPVCRSQLQRVFFSTSAHRTENSRRGNSNAVAIYPPTHSPIHSPTNSPIHSPTYSQPPTHSRNCHRVVSTSSHSVKLWPYHGACQLKLAVPLGWIQYRKLTPSVSVIHINSCTRLQFLNYALLGEGKGGGASCPTSQWQIISNTL